MAETCACRYEILTNIEKYEKQMDIKFGRMD
jgi:hypothetical protein